MTAVGHKLEFSCQNCHSAVAFSVLDRAHFEELLVCEGCGKKYLFDDETLLGHLQQFEALCRQIHASHEILGDTAIAIDVGRHHVKVPFNILLTRLSSVLELEMNGQKAIITFRVEPLRDMPDLLEREEALSL